MHNKAQEMGGGSYCSAGTVCDCASVIGNPEWNTVPVLGVPWGLMGMLVFALFMWVVITMAKEPTAEWVLTNIKIGKYDEKSKILRKLENWKFLKNRNKLLNFQFF